MTDVIRNYTQHIKMIDGVINPTPAAGVILFLFLNRINNVDVYYSTMSSGINYASGAL